MCCCPAFCWTRFSFTQIQTNHPFPRHLQNPGVGGVIQCIPLSRRGSLNTTYFVLLCSCPNSLCWSAVSVLFSGWLSTHPTSPRSLRVAWSRFSTTRPWSVTSQACQWPTPPCSTRGRLLLRPCSSATGIYCTSQSQWSGGQSQLVLWNGVESCELKDNCSNTLGISCIVCSRIKSYVF